MSDNIAIKVDNVSKTFKLPHEKQTSVKSAVVNFYKRKRTYEKQEVLKDISFEVKKGEFFGIVGRNGSGKSTLLKIIAGIYKPNEGKVTINGKLVPFIELGVGFNPELTGRENVFLNGALLGFNRKEMEVMYQDIVKFAELEKFMDQKLKNYSSGMQVRLAFSIAIRANADILVLDEVLAVGDQSFQQKCYDYFYDLKRQGQTVVLVTHDMSAVRKFCDRGAVIDKGKLKIIGSPSEITKEYEKINMRSMEPSLTQENAQKKKYAKREGSGHALIEKVETFNPKTLKPQSTFFQDEEIGVRITFEIKRTVKQPSVGFIFQDAHDNTVFATNNHVRGVVTKNLTPPRRLVLESIVGNIFTDGKHTITCAIESEDLQNIYDRIERIHSFLINGHDLPHATTHPEHTFKLTYTG
jgi:ABC-2 type transport system ATP-binding protein